MATSIPPATRPSRRKSTSNVLIDPGAPQGNLDQQQVRQTPDQAAAPKHQFDVVNAGPGDHPSILNLLNCVFQAPSQAEFQAQLEQPHYEPTDRLIVKRGDEVVAHVRNLNRELYFGPTILPVTYVSELATGREYRDRGIASALIEAAENRARSEGAVFAVTRTRVPQLFEQRGWTPCIRHCFSTAAPRDLLAHLNVTGQANPVEATNWVAKLHPGFRPPQPLNIRLWRHVEQAALARLYDENMRLTYGPIVRSEAYWRWLVSRHGYERIYVAIEGPDKLDLDDLLEPIVGYAGMKEGRIVEMMTSPTRPDAAVQLLARACGDAIERDHHEVQIDGASGNPLHQVFSLAGGNYVSREMVGGDTIMVKLFDPLGFLEGLCATVHERAKAASLPRPTELGILLDGEKYQLTIAPRSVRFDAGRLGRSYLTCGTAQLAQLLLGHLNVKQSVAAERLQASTQVAVETASVLFPRLPFWLPPLDDLPA
jgi:predicted N-acetyltransferase YhbS